NPVTGSTTHTHSVDTTALIDIRMIAGESQSPITTDANNYATISSTDKTNGFTVSGITTGIEVNQTVSIQALNSSGTAINGAIYTTTVGSDGTWTANIPANASWIVDGSSYSFKASVTDIAGNSATDVDKLNAKPVDTNETNTVNEDMTLTVTDGATGDLLNNAIDADGDTLSISGYTIMEISGTQNIGTPVSIAGVGTITINANGSYSFVPVSNYNGNVPTITYIVSDGKGGSDTSTLNIGVNPVNDAPTIGNSSVTANVSEEGLTGGIVDTIGSPSDTTNLSVSTGTMNISDIDSSVAVTLSAPTAPMTSAGTTVMWSGSGTNTLVGSAGDKVIMTISIDNTGSYTVTLKGPIDHATTGVEDIKTLSVGVNATDGALTTTGTLAINIEDDAPIAGNITQSIILPSQDTNILLVVDVSGSMADPSGIAGKTRLEATKDALNQLLDQYDSFGDIKVRIVTFSSNANPQGTIWTDIATAKTYIANMTSNGSTDYDAALADGMSAYESTGKLDNAKNVGYFISDGAPNQNDNNTSTLTDSSSNYSGSADNGIQTAEETIWKNFLNNNDVQAYSIGIGTGLPANAQTILNPIAYNGQISTDTNAIIVTDMSQLSSELQKTVIPPIPGSLNGNIGNSAYGLGADGGYVKSVTIDGVTYTYNPTTHSMSVSGGTSTNSFDVTTNAVTITTVKQGILVVDFDAATYTYQAPATLASSSTMTETIGFTLTDNDTDSASGTLTLNVTHASEILLTSTSTTMATSGMGLSGEYFGYNDNTTSTTNGYLGSSTRVHTDDGTQSNLTSLAKIETIIEGRNNDTTLVGSSHTGSASAADATFTANKLEYGLTAGTSTPLFSNDLGQNTKVTANNTVNSSNNNLYAFLKGSNTANASTITATSGVGDTTDAIIRMVGYVYVVGGTYDLRVTADDGYRILIGNQSLAEADYIQSTTTKVYTGLSIADGWQPIEILYWDQGGHASFRLETKLSGTLDTAYQIVSTDTMPILNANQTPPVLTAQQDMVDTGTGTWSIRTGATYNGDASDDYVTGTDGKDVIHGGAGNDVIDGGANKDWIYGDEGNDTILFDAKDVLMDGGSGIDTLLLPTGTNIDFSALNTTNNPIKNIEVIDLGTTGAHSLTNLSLQDVIDMTDSNHTLTIIGNSADSVSVDSTLTKTGTTTETMNGTTYAFDVYTHTNASDPTVTVKIEQDVTHS
ncbi:MAG: hypothetical protein CJD30_09850, partial [Sulfuricurvum sp. PD_MW2]